MCGIAGIVHLDPRPVSSQLLERMTRSLAHRGPDGEGYALLSPRGGKPLLAAGALSDSVRTVPPEYTVGFGHRRLAVLDPSPLGHQPMATEDERSWITYNGELYNFVELRAELQQLGYEFRSRTDTEVVLKAYQHWGDACLERFNGMFAFAIWDGRRSRLFCARDRLGMKPFYYRLEPGGLRFASEIKALVNDSTSPASPNPRAIHDFLVLGLLDHTEDTCFQGIRQLRPGQCLIVQDGRPVLRRWWDLEAAEPQEASDAEWIDHCKALLSEAVRLHLRSDVAVGSCLSGGLDSSSIVCEMVRQRRAETDRFTTFSSCLPDPQCDERPYLHAVVAQTGVRSIEVMPDAPRLLQQLPEILWYQDEPFGSTSFLAQWAVMEAAGRHGIKVLLDGQGADELLCGYPGYWGSYLGDLLRQGRMAALLRELNACRRAQTGLPPTVWANLARAVLPTRVVTAARAQLKAQRSWINPSFAVQYATPPIYPDRFGSALQNHIAAYLQSHSLPALLHHEDRNAMAFSLEARLPFLDARFVDFAFRLPAAFKLRDGLTKYLLRGAMAGRIPEAVRLRTDKMGFPTPQDRWLRDTWRPEIESLFAAPSFRQREYWDARQVRKSYERYCLGETSIGTAVWRWVCVELWHRRFFP